MRGLNKSSTDITEQQKPILDEIISSNQQKLNDENGITFLVYLFKDRF
jgi:hypothetical protein